MDVYFDIISTKKFFYTYFILLCEYICIFLYILYIFFLFISIFPYVFKKLTLYCYRKYLYPNLLNIMKIISIYFYHTNFYLKYLC